MFTWGIIVHKQVLPTLKPSLCVRLPQNSFRYQSAPSHVTFRPTQLLVLLFYFRRSSLTRGLILLFRYLVVLLSVSGLITSCFSVLLPSLLMYLECYLLCFWSYFLFLVLIILLVVLFYFSSLLFSFCSWSYFTSSCWSYWSFWSYFYSRSYSSISIVADLLVVLFAVYY